MGMISYIKRLFNLKRKERFCIKEVPHVVLNIQYKKNSTEEENKKEAKLQFIHWLNCLEPNQRVIHIFHNNFELIDGYYDVSVLIENKECE